MEVILTSEVVMESEQVKMVKQILTSEGSHGKSF